MSIPRGPYTLHYWLRLPFTPDETGRQEHFNNIGDALSRASRVSQEGGKPTHLIYDEAVLFFGDDFTELVKQIPSNVGHEGTSSSGVLTTLSEALVKQLAKTVKVSEENFGAVAVYRDLLEELYSAADEAIKKKDLQLLHSITGKLTFSFVPGEHDVRQWGKDFLHAYRRDFGWLRDTKKALEKIRDAAKDLEVEGQRNEELREQIMKAADDGLIMHI